MGVDRVVVAPAADVEDPLHDYYRALGFGFIGGGISSLPAPLDGPRTLSLELNEQVRFQRPGQYGIPVESGRFEGGGRGAAHERLIVVSNLLTLEITAPAADEPTETLAARALRFADTPRAARELARRLLRLEGDAVVACALAVDASRGASAVREALDDASSRCRDSLPETLVGERFGGGGLMWGTAAGLSIPQGIDTPKSTPMSRRLPGRVAHVEGELRPCSCSGELRLRSGLRC